MKSVLAGCRRLQLGDGSAYSKAQEKQAAADIMLSIEPDGLNPLLKTFLPSKILDYIAARKPILAITPEDSEAWRLCKRGFGWAIRPGDARSGC